MADIRYALYLDESGDFENDDAVSNLPRNPSLVGGLLCDPKWMTDKRASQLLPERVHCCKFYDKQYLSVLETLQKNDSQLVIFENRERLNVVNCDITYLNIISEGLVRLLHNLKLKHSEANVHVNIVVATRKAVTKERGIIPQDDYKERIAERLQLAAARSNMQVCGYDLNFEDARYFRMLDFADIICNTYLTREAKGKFTEEDRDRIKAVYKSEFVLSVFENATVGYLKHLLQESRYSEMMYQISTLKKLDGVKLLRGQLLDTIEKSTPAEQEAYFSYLSLQIGLYNSRSMYSDGILFAENYKKYFLNAFKERGKISGSVSFWIFDTDFYILTMYDHLGNTGKCAEYLEKCRANISSINHSWEHIDYYFKFRVRELNCLMGRFDFRNVVEKADALIDIFSNAKVLFDMIETYDGTANQLRSELLGKAYGVRLEAYTNLLVEEPGLFEKALETSDLALKEFVAENDLHRQNQSRCVLMLTAGKPLDALDCLLQSFSLQSDMKNVYHAFMERVYIKRAAPDLFALWHYTSVMVALKEENLPQANEMFVALNASSALSEDLKAKTPDGYPWNMILWNLSRWYRMNGSPTSAEKHYKHAARLTKKDPAKVTMWAFSLSISADHLLGLLSVGKLTPEKARSEMQRERIAFEKLQLPDTVREHFRRCEKETLEKTLLAYSRAFLK